MDKSAAAPYPSVMRIDADIDAIGLLCPLPVLKLQKRLAAMPKGAVAKLRTADPASWIDVPHFCAQTGHEMLSADDLDGVKTYYIRKV